MERLVPCMSGSSKRTNSIPSELQPSRIFPASVAISWLGRLLSDRCDSFEDWPRRQDEYDSRLGASARPIGQREEVAVLETSRREALDVDLMALAEHVCCRDLADRGRKLEAVP